MIGRLSKAIDHADDCINFAANEETKKNAMNLSEEFKKEYQAAIGAPSDFNLKKRNKSLDNSSIHTGERLEGYITTIKGSYGFIFGSNKVSYFFHHSDLINSPEWRFIRKGDIVSFLESEDPIKPNGNKRAFKIIVENLITGHFNK